MPPIQTIASPRRDKISVTIPKEYRSYSFQVILVPLAPEGVKEERSPRRAPRRRSKTFVDALLSCPKLDKGLDISRDHEDFGREIDL